MCWWMDKLCRWSLIQELLSPVKTLHKLLPIAVLQPCMPSSLEDLYTGQLIDAVGQLTCTGAIQWTNLWLIIAGQGPSLFGRDWLKKIQLDWRSIGLMDTSRVQLNNTLQRYHLVFEDSLGTMKKFQAELHLKDPLLQTVHGSSWSLGAWIGSHGVGASRGECQSVCGLPTL